MATKKQAPTKKAAAAKSTGSILPLGNRRGNPADKSDWKKRRAAMDKAIDGKK